MNENQKTDLVILKIETLQEDISYIREKIVLVEKHEKILYGNPEEASSGKCGLINQVAGQGRSLDTLRGYVTKVGTYINIAVAGIVSGIVAHFFRKS